MENFPDGILILICVEKIIYLKYEFFFVVLQSQLIFMKILFVCKSGCKTIFITIDWFMRN